MQPNNPSDKFPSPHHSTNRNFHHSYTQTHFSRIPLPFSLCTNSPSPQPNTSSPASALWPSTESARERAATVHPRGKKRIRERQKFFWFRPWVEVRQREAVSELHPSALPFLPAAIKFPAATTTSSIICHSPRKSEFQPCVRAERKKNFPSFCAWAELPTEVDSSFRLAF